LGGSHQNLSHQFDYKFQGKEQNTFSGYYDFGARMYDPATLRFLQVDKLADAPNQIPFSYYSPFNNSPLVFVDPSGDSSVKYTDLNMQRFDSQQDEILLDEVKVTSRKNGWYYGWENFARETVGGGLVRWGWPSEQTSGKPAGATQGTSKASLYLRKKFPQSAPNFIRRYVKIPTGIAKTGIRMSRVTTVGAGLGRLVPWVGWGLLIWDAIDLSNGIIESLNDTPSEFWGKARRETTTIGLYDETSQQTLEQKENEP
jgi:RHS repeat-associated protein